MTFIMYFSLLPPYICGIQSNKRNEIKTTTYANDLFRRSISSNEIKVFKLFRSRLYGFCQKLFFEYQINKQGVLYNLNKLQKN